jgi:hypothetical protein
MPTEEIVTFEGVYDPPDEIPFETLTKMKSDEEGFLGTVTFGNQKKEILMRLVSEKKGAVTIVPIDEDGKEWIKEHIF